MNIPGKLLVRLSTVGRFRGKNYANLNSVNMAYNAFGDESALSSPPVVVMHSLFGSKRTWQSACKLINDKTSPQRTVFAVDARNHGESPHTDEHTYPHMAEDIKAFIKKLNVKKASLLGHSMGGRASMYLALKDPTVVEKLIVGDISPISHPQHLDHFYEIVELVKNVHLPKNMSMMEARKFVDAQLSHIVLRKSERDFLLTNLAEGVNNRWMLNITSLALSLPDLIAFPAVSNLKFEGPVLFIIGEKSKYVDKSDFPEILKLFPKAEFYVLPGAHHWLTDVNFTGFIDKCVSFLNKS